ncbi:MAG: hypothetical protein ACE5EY_01550 [Anaerolineae bacterium]
MIILRLIHIFCAIFWVGTTLFMVGFLETAVQASGPEGGKVMQKLVGSTRFPLVIAIAGWLTVLSGLWMYWQMTGFHAAVMFDTRLPLTLGAIAGIAAGIVGTVIQGRASGQLAALGQEMAAQTEPPSPEQLAALGGLQATLKRGGRLNAVLMALAVIGMVI